MKKLLRLLTRTYNRNQYHKMLFLYSGFTLLLISTFTILMFAYFNRALSEEIDQFDGMCVLQPIHTTQKLILSNQTKKDLALMHRFVNPSFAIS